MENFIFGTILIIAGFIIVRMAYQPPTRRPLIFNSLVFTTLMPTILIIGGLWLSSKAGWYFAIIAFLIAMFIAGTFGRKGNRRAHAIVLLSKLSEELTKNMVNILLAHRNNDIDGVNKITGTIDLNALGQLIKLIGPEDRPAEFSSGKFGDNLSWTVMEGALQDKGYTNNSSKIIAGIILHDLDVVLMKINKRKNKGKI